LKTGGVLRQHWPYLPHSCAERGFGYLQYDCLHLLKASERAYRVSSGLSPFHCRCRELYVQSALVWFLKSLQLEPHGREQSLQLGHRPDALVQESS
jgi:hypothetical protein